MTDLYLHNRKLESVFRLLGEHENDISCSVAWALARCPSFLGEFLHGVIGQEVDTSDVSVRLQHHEPGGGYTDIEIVVDGQFHIIVEAKRGWNLPGRNQLEKYATRFRASSAPIKCLIVMSECNYQYAKAHLEISDVAGVQIKPVSWKEMAAYASNAKSEGSNAEKRLIAELLTYLGVIMTMQQQDSNWVYVVSLASNTPPGWGISWIDIVRKQHRYFHPRGKGWPKEPPNYIAFRYNGKLQSIHHIESYEVIANVSQRIPEIPETEWEPRPHFLYTLGEPFAPNKEVRTGKIYPNGRVRCMLDTLFTCDTISDARDLSQKRKK